MSVTQWEELDSGTQETRQEAEEGWEDVQGQAWDAVSWWCQWGGGLPGRRWGIVMVFSAILVYTFVFKVDAK